MEVPVEPSSQGVLLNGVKTHCKGNINSLREKTPMCLVNELARFNQIPHQYRLTHEDGPAHKKVFTVTLKLGDEEYQSDGSSIKKAQHSAAQLALNSTQYKHPPEKSKKPITSRRNITPTVELNALAMKRGEVTEYTFVEEPAYAQANGDGHHSQGRFRGRGRGFRGYRPFRRGFQHSWGPGFMGHPPGVPTQAPLPEDLYRVVLKVSGREYTGCGVMPQSARHDAATKALKHMRELEQHKHGEDNESCAECPGERKSPVSLVHEMALKRKLSVTFEVVEEKGQPHMRMYFTRCKVGDLVTMGEGNGKKISKGKAAELMLDELGKLPEITENPKSRFKRRIGGAPSSNNVRGGKRRGGRNVKPNDKSEVRAAHSTLERGTKKDEPCYVEQLLAYQKSQEGVEPVYQVVETKLITNSKKKEFTMQVSLGDKTVMAISSNKKAAMRNAAHMMLIELGQSPAKPPAKKKPAKKVKISRVVEIFGDDDRPPEVPEGSVPAPPALSTPVPAPGGRQPVDLDKTVRIAQEYLATGSSPTADALTRRRKNRKPLPASNQGPSHPKDQLGYLAQLAGFTVQYSDFPNPNSQPGYSGPTQGHLSLVHLSTSPPQVCTGVGSTVEQSQDEAALSALKFISDMGLESISSLTQDSPVTSQTPDSNSRTPLKMESD